MKITKVEVFRLPTANSKQNSPIGCRIHTDVGIRGDGEAGMAYGVGGSGAFGMPIVRMSSHRQGRPPPAFLYLVRNVSYRVLF